MDVPTPTDGALGQPTRARLFAELSDLRRPAGTEELAAALALHPNGLAGEPAAVAAQATARPTA